MSRSALRLTRLIVHRMSGIEDRFEIDTLSPGVNLIHGPNGSGKTSTASAIDALIWGRASDSRDGSFAGDYQLGDAAYHVTVDARSHSVQRDGKNTAPPQLPSSDVRSCYTLALHDLSGSDGADFAGEVMRQSAGGFDVKAAMKALGFHDTAPTSSAHARALQAAQNKRREAQQRQLGLHDEASVLAGLERDRDAARGALRRKELLALAIRHADAHGEVETARADLSAYPEQLAKFRGGELGDFDDACERRETSERERDAARVDMERARRDANDALPGGPVADTLIPLIRAEIGELDESERAVAAAVQAVAGARAYEEEVRHSFARDATVEQLRSIDATGIGDLGEFGREAERHHAEKAAEDAELALAGKAVGAGGGDNVREGLGCLYGWLREGSVDRSGEQRLRKFVWAAVLLAVVASAVLVIHVGIAWIVIAAIAVVIGVIASKAAQLTDGREQYQRDYSRLGLPTPDSWGMDSVQALVARLQKQDGDAVVEAVRAEWRGRAAERLARIAERERDIEVRRVALVARFGVAPDTDARTLSWLVDRLGRWSDADAEVARCVACLDAARACADKILLRLGERFTGRKEWGIPLTLAEARAYLGEIERRVGNYSDARHREDNARDRLLNAEKGIESAAAQVNALLQRIGMSAEDRDVLDDLCRQHDAFRAASERARVASQRGREVRQELEEVAWYEPDLATRRADVLAAEMVEVSAESERLEPLIREITALETRINEAKQLSDVEDALLGESAAFATLEAACRKDIAAMVGSVIAKHAEHATRDLHTPAVFLRARELFLRVTRGRYRLDMAADGERAFRALDTTTNVGQRLEELSSATRVQLLLSVRIAFLETTEEQAGCAMLPVMFDETLGTSDDQRARSIIETALALAESGRQIFYFTAQSDEIEKWKAVMAGRTVDCIVTDVARARRALAVPESDRFSFTSSQSGAIPEPGSMTHDEYGVALGVRGIRPGRDAVGATHIWYLIEDPHTIARLMRAGISTWGQLSAIGQSGELSLAALDGVFQRAATCARVIDALHTCTNIGRGRRVDRSTLVESGVISPTFMERVTELANELDGDPVRLLAALEGGRVTRFHSGTTEALRTYLSDNNYIPTEFPLSAQEIQQRAVLVAFGDIDSGAVTMEDIDRLLSRIATGPAVIEGAGEQMMAGSLSLSAPEKALA
jgi:hypothetical protein